MTAYDSLHSLLDYERLLSHCDWLGSDLRVGHFFSFRRPLANTPQLNTQVFYECFVYDLHDSSTTATFTIESINYVSSFYNSVTTSNSSCIGLFYPLSRECAYRIVV
jgi:hypothetical protein